MLLFKDLKVVSSFEYISIYKLSIVRRINNHGFGFLECLIDDSNKNSIYKITSNSNIKIINTKANLPIFDGIIINFKEIKVNGLDTIRLIFASHSIKLDYKLIRESYQDPAQTYDAVLSTIIKERNQGDCLNSADKGKVKKIPLIQYDETDWAFVKRVASNIDAKIYVDVRQSWPQIFVGLNTGDEYKDLAFNYVIEKNNKEFLQHNARNNKFSELQFVRYTFESYEEYNLGDKVFFNSLKFAVYYKKTIIKNSILTNIYKIIDPNYFKEDIFYNKKLTGASIEGKILKVEKNKIKLHLDIDKSQDEGKAYFYEFDTPYSTESQTGVYIMPELDQKAKLYVANPDETKAFAKRIFRIDGDSNPKTNDPKKKYLGTIHKNEMMLDPKEVKFHQIENQMFISMHETDGITIKSNKDIKIGMPKKNMADKIYLQGKEITIIAKSQITIATPKANVLVNKLVHLKGS